MPTPPQPLIDPGHVTGLVLAGGRGSRMGGVDKGLQPHHGVPLALHALRRLQPQVGAVMVNANRNLEAYAAFGAPVWPDAPAADAEAYPGPLAGMLAGLAHCTTPYLATVPCDTPDFPADLVARLAAALRAEGAELALAATRAAEGGVQPEPVFALLPRALHDSLAAYLRGGGRKVDRWAGQHRCAVVVFDDAAAFFNANTAAELQRLQR